MTVLSGSTVSGESTFGRVDDRLISAMQAVVGADQVRTTAGDLAPYARDATPLFHRVFDLVMFPGSTAEVSAVLRLATEARVPVVPRGAGSSLCAGTVALQGGIVLVLTRMNKIREISSEELLAVVETGVTTAELGAAAAAKNLLFPPDPGSKTVATVSSSSELISLIWFIRVRTSTMPPESATVPAHRLEPAPRGTTGTRASVAKRRTADTSAVDPGNTTRSGT